MKKLVAILSLGLSLLGYSQSNDTVLIETSADTPVVVCGDPVNFTIKLTNRSENTLTGLTYSSRFANGMTLESSEFTNAGSNIEPIFALTGVSIPGNSTFSFTYTAKGDCTLLADFDSASNQGDTFTVVNDNLLQYTVNGGANQAVSGDSESFGINFPELFVKVKDEDVNIQLDVLEKDADGSVFNREIEVTNSGLGPVREYRLYVDYDQNISFEELKLNTGTVLTPTGAPTTSPKGANFLRLEYLISDFSEIGNGDEFFQQNESFTFIDKVSLDPTDCFAGMETNYTAVYGCNNTFCEDSNDNDATSVNYLTFIQGRPTFISRVFLEKSGDFCGDPIQLRLEYTNNGSGSILPQADSAFDIQITESEEIFRNLGANSIKLNGVELTGTEFSSFTRFDFGLNDGGLFSTDPDGPGVGLDDLDNDGLYDDLPVGATLILQMELVLSYDPTIIDNISRETLNRTTIYGKANSCNSTTYNGTISVNVSSFENSISDVVPDQLETGDTETFMFDVRYNYLLRDNYNLGLMKPQENFVSRFKVPQGYTVNAVKWFKFGADPSQTLSANELGGGVYEVQGGGSWGRYEVEVTVGCSDSLGETIENVEWNMYIDICGDNSSSELLEIAATSTSIFTIFERCTTDGGPGGPGGGGDVCDFTTESFDVARNTFGYVEGWNGNTTYTKGQLASVPRVNENTAGIDLDAAYPLDKVIFSGTGTLDTDGTETYNQIGFSFAYNLPEGVTEGFFNHSEDGELLVNGVAYALSNPTVEVGTNRITYTYITAISPVSGTGITLEVKDLELELDKKSDIPLSSGIYKLPILRGKFVGTSSGGNIQTCGTSVGTDFSVYIPDSNIFINRNSVAGCAGSGSLIINSNIGSATGGDDFPNEYRPVFIFNRLQYQIPPGYQLRDDAPYMNAAHYYNLGTLDTNTAITEYSLNNNNVQVEFDNISVLSADANRVFFSLLRSFEPDCDAGYTLPNLGSTVNFVQDVYYTDLLEDPNVSIDYFGSQNTSNIARLRDTYNVPFETTANVVQEGFERETDWPVQICNEVNTFYSISNPWVALELKANDSSTILVGAIDQEGNRIPDEDIVFYGPLNTNSGTPRNMLVRIDTRIAPQTCITIYPIAEYRVCENDIEQNIDLISSWSCDTFPLLGEEYDEESERIAINSIKDPGLLSCQYNYQEDIIKLRYKTGDLDWEVTRLQDEVDLCESLDFEVKVVSAKFANVYDTKVTVRLPEGVSATDVSAIQYTYDGAAYTNVPNTFIQYDPITTQTLVIDASGLVTDRLVATNVLADASESTIPGIRLPGKNEITFRLGLTSDCNYNPGQPVTFNLTGTTNCSEDISVDLGRFMPIKGIELPEIDVDIIANDFLVCEDQNEVTVVVTNNHTGTLSPQQLVVTLPAGVSYAESVTGFAQPDEVAGDTVKWNLSNLETNTTQTFKINTTLLNASGLSFEYRAETIQNGQATCVADNEACDLQITTGQGLVEVLNSPFPEITVTPVSSLPVCEGEDVVVEVNLSGNVGGSYTYQWNIAPIATNGNQFTFRPLNSTQLTVTVQSSTNTSANCSGSASIDIGVYPGAQIAITVDQGVSCAGQNDGGLTIQITGEQGTGYVEQGPFEIIEATYPDLVTIGQQLNSGESITVANVPQGEFSITFKDNYGCTFEQSINVPRSTTPIGNFCTTLLACGATSGDIEMSFETRDVHPALTGTNYSGRVYSTSGGEDLVSFTGTFTDTQTHVLTDVSTTSVYVLEISAENGCTFTRGFRPQALTVRPSITNATDPDFYEVCFANETKDLTLGISNNTSRCTDFEIPSYTVFFGLVDENQEFVGTPQEFSNVGATLELAEVGVGSYKVTVVPSTVNNYNGAIADCEAELLFEITAKSKFNAEVQTMDPTCFGDTNGSASVVVTGSSGTVTYEWKNVTTDEVVSIGYSATDLGAGEYQVIITDESGCGTSDPILFTLEEPEVLEIPIIEDIQTSCDAVAGAGAADGTAIGYTSGVAPYRFSWYQIVDGAEVLEYEETDVAAGETSSYPGIEPGDYKVVITDANGCTVATEVTAVTEPPVKRTYNLCLQWESPIIREAAPPTPNDTREIDPIGATDFRQAITSKVERCVIESKAQLESAVQTALEDVEALDDAVVLDYTQGASDVYHFTLYYYDRAGNLVRTVPPEGVQTVQGRVATAHTLVTGYDYNSIAQLASQNTPDGGTSQFIYNDIGQLWYSQNERQAREQVFSYVIYDELGRVREGGEAQLNGKTFPNDFVIDNQANPQVAFDIIDTDKTEFIQTTYNDRIAEITYLGQSQRFLRNNVSFINNKDRNGDITKTYYSYDPHGNVEWCVQEIPGIGRTTVAYTYDLVSGNVNEVHFNKGKIAEYRHKYHYDEDNRVVSVQTSKDGYIWDEDARYDYYLHGPLMRTELGEDKVQGLDYTYTIHGWLKGINTPNLEEESAYSPDGNNVRGDLATKHAKDEFGMALGYYQGDFTRDGVFNSGLTAANPFNMDNQVNGVAQNLYNGNISTWTSQVAEEAKDKGRDSYLTGNAYRYDQLNRIKAATTQVYNEASQSYGAIAGNVDAFKTQYTYDKNGNLMTLKRHKEDGQLIDDLVYAYDLSADNMSNRLRHVKDARGQVSTEINDLPDQPDDNYTYDETGRLVRDESEGLTYLWTASDKVSQIVPDHTNDVDTQKVHMSFTYDGMSMRTIKTVNRQPYNDAGEGPAIHNPAAVTSTYYSCDASGNVMGIYTRKDEKVNPDDVTDNRYTATFSISERPIYGTDRVGQDVFEEVVYTRTYGFDELANYEEVAVEFMSTITSALSNVLVVQQNDQELTDLSGATVTVTASTVATAKADKAFNALVYETQQGEANVLPIQTDNNVILIEDKEGEVISYGMVAQNYFSATPDRSVLLLYDADGALLPGLELINADSLAAIDPMAKTVVVRHPSNPAVYLLFYRDVAAELHCATINTAGGIAITKHEGFAYSNYGRHMAVIQDDQQKIAYLYASMHSDAIIADDGTVTTPAGFNLVRFTIDEAGAVSFDGSLLPEYVTSFDNDGNGELQIAKDGSAISIYHNTSLPAQWTENADAEIRTWQLDEETRLPIAESVQAIAVTNGNIGKGSLINTGTEIYYTQYTQEVTTSVDNKVVKRASDGAVVTAQGLGDLRLNRDDKLYQFIGSSDSGQEWSLDTQGLTALNNLPTSTGGSTGYQPYQPYTVLQEAEAATDGIVYRHMGNKYYELKDHLGNVRVVVGDRKHLEPSTGALTASVESYNNYYPFGMLQPNRHKDSKSYRYGFQGQEKDDEIKGEGNSVNYKYRMHDPRLGRFFMRDPLAEEFEFQSPYAFAANNPIAFIEILGLGPGDPIKHTVKKGDNLNKISKKYGVSIEDLAKMNNIENINHIEIGQVLDVNPEANFSKNPRGSYKNPNNEYGKEVEMDNIAMIGINFVVGRGEENTVIVGGKALVSVQQWKEVGKLIESGVREIKSDGKIVPGEAVSRTFSAGDLPSNIKKGLKEAWHKIKNRENPWKDNSQNSPIHVLGSFNLSIRVNADGVSATVAIYDSKTFRSFSDGNASEESNKNREDSKYKFLTNTYQRYLWNIDLTD